MKPPASPLISRLLPGEGEEHILRLLESISDGFCAFDAQWRFSLFNDAAKRILAPYLENPEDLLGRNFWESFPDTIGTVIEAQLRRAFNGDDAAEFEFFYPPWSVWFAARCFPIRGGGLSIYFRDVTREKQEVETVRTNEERYRELARQLTLAKEAAERSARSEADAAERFRMFSNIASLQVWTATPDGALDYANPHVVQRLGLDLERDVLGFAWMNLIHPDDVAGTKRRWEYSLTTGERYEAEFRMRMKDGQYRWMLTRAEAQRGDDGRIVKWYGCNTDIHDLKMAQRATEAASKAKDDFLAALSHELRTPLTPVLMAAEDLCADPELPAAMTSTMSMMRRNIQLEARLIDDMLDLTRIANGKLALREQDCETHSLLRLAIEIVRDDAQTKGLVFDVEFAAQQTFLRGDPARLQQAFWNLLKNAIKFTPASGHVGIRSHDESGHIVITVSDTGIGIPADSLARIFQPFEQGGLANNHRFGGLGLGLAITRAVVEMHGGTITAESPGPGRGSTFCIKLPAIRRNPGIDGTRLRTLIEASENSRISSSHSLRLLLVEDHEPTLDVLARLLTRAGHKVFTATTVSAALEVAARVRFDAVVSDIGLPDGTGIELMTSLHAAYGLRGIALSGYGMEEDLRRSREAGFVAHLVKPVDFTQLRRSLLQLAASSSREAATAWFS